MKKHALRGFTLIELLVVIAIIGILTALVTVNFLGVRQKGRDSERKSDLKQIQTALEFYRSDVGFYPSTLYSTACPTSAAFVSGATTYMQLLPCDPLSNAGYTYTPSGCVVIDDCTGYEIRSCLENPNDPDDTLPDVCPGDQVTFRVNNP